MTYVFKLQWGRLYAHYAAQAKNQSEAAQRVCAEIGGTNFSTGLISHREFSSPDDPEIRTFKNVVFCR